MHRDLLRDTWFRIGLFFAVFGCGPLLIILVLHTLGLLSDPNPNPVGPGILFLLTSWPGVICMAIGVRRVQRPDLLAARRQQPRAPLAEGTPVRIAAGVGAGLLLLRGAFDLLVVGNFGRGPAAGIVIGLVLGWWALVGKAPRWWGR